MSKNGNHAKGFNGEKIARRRSRRLEDKESRSKHMVPNNWLACEGNCNCSVRGQY